MVDLGRSKRAIRGRGFLAAWACLLLVGPGTLPAQETQPEGIEKGGGFHPRNLVPDFYVESVATFTNPLTNAECTGASQPNYCCTGPGTGTCDQPVDSFRLATCTTRNLDCTAAGVPHACCTGLDTGNCCFEISDTAEGGLGSPYCPASECPDGCVQQWVDQSGFRSNVVTHPVTGRTFEQDDLEKPCYVPDCLNGHACVVGHGPWEEPEYLTSQQPTQDATLEIEPADRTGAIFTCSGAFYLAQLVRIENQTRDHRLLAGFTKRIVEDNSFQFRAFSGAETVSVPDVFPRFGAWYFIELQRNNDNTLQVWIDGEERTRTPAPSNSSSRVFAYNAFCDTKTCNLIDNEEFQGAGALLFYRCGAAPGPNQKALFRTYVLETFTNGIFDDGFETGDVSRWDENLGAVLFADDFESGNLLRWTSF